MLILKAKNYWHRLSSDQHTILVSMAQVSTFVLLGKIAGAIKEMAVAWRYGISDTVDAYLFVFNLISWPVSIWTSVLSVVLIPLVSRIEKESPSELSRFRAQMMASAIISGSLLSVILFFSIPMLLTSRWVGLPENTAVIALELLPGLSMLGLLGVAIGLYSTWTMSEGRHANTLFESIPAAAILAGVLLTGGIEPLLWGTLAGSFIQLVFLIIPFAKKGELDLPDFRFSSHWWSPFKHSFIVMMIGQFLMSITGIIDQFFAAHLGEGSISTLGYNNRILSLILGLGATAVSRATLPVFSQMNSRDHSGLMNTTLKTAKLMLLLGTLGLLIGWLLTPLAVKFLFERGAFTANNTQAVSGLLRISLTMLPFYFSGLVFVSYLASHGKHREITKVASINLAVKIILSAIMVPRWGLVGLLAATTIMYVTSAWLCMKFTRLHSF